MNNCFSSDDLSDEIKHRIKDKFGNQEKFAKQIGMSRKALSRFLNKEIDDNLIWIICNLLDIKGIVFLKENQ